MRPRKPSGMTLAIAGSVAVIAYLLLAPLVVQLASSLRGPFLPLGLPGTRWSLVAYRQLYMVGGGGLLATVRATALYVAGATMLSVSLGWALAWLVVRTDLPGRNVIAVLAIVPFVIPPIVRAQAYVLMLSPTSGVLNQMLRLLPFWRGASGPIDPFSFVSMTMVQGLSSVAFPFLLFMPILRNMDGTLEEAARVSGATWVRTLRTVTLPLLWPGTLGVIALSSMLMLGNLEVPLLFGQQSGRDIFALRLWNLITPAGGQLPAYGVAAAYGVTFLAVVAVIFVLYLRATRHAARWATVTGKAFRPAGFLLGRWRVAVLALVTLFLIPTAVLPIFALAWSAITPYPLTVTWFSLVHHTSLSAFHAVLADPEFWASLTRTVIIAGVSSTIATAVAAIAAFAVARGRNRVLATGLDILATSSVAIPAVIAGFSSFLFYLVINRWVPLSGTIWAMAIAYAYRLSVSYRTSHAAVLQIHPELEQAAAVSGADRLTAFRRIVMPLLLPTATASWIQLFILGANEFTLAAFLSTPQSQPLSMYLYGRINPESGQLYAPNQGAAMALIFTVMVVLASYGLNLAVRRRLPGQTTTRARMWHAAVNGISH